MRLSPDTDEGMYDVKQETPTRTKTTGFVLPSNDEWIKPAYYDPKGGGTDSYWEYPTGPFRSTAPVEAEPRYGRCRQRRHAASVELQPERPRRQPEPAGLPTGPGPHLVPLASRAVLRKRLPTRVPHVDPDSHSLYTANVSTVGQTKTPSPWGTTREATSSRPSTRSRRSRLATASSGTGATTTGASPTPLPISWGSRPSATTRATRIPNRSIRGLASASASSERSSRSGHRNEIVQSTMVEPKGEA